MRAFDESVFIVHPHPVVRRGYEFLLTLAFETKMAGSTGSLSQAMNVLPGLSPRILIVDPLMEAGRGFAFIEEIRAKVAGISVLITGQRLTGEDVRRALRAGAIGGIHLEDSEGGIHAALVAAAGNQRHLSPSLSALLVDSEPATDSSGAEGRMSRLSERERHLFQLLGQALTGKELAEKLIMSIKTVETHMAHIKTKLHLRNNAELRRAASVYAAQIAGGGACNRRMRRSSLTKRWVPRIVFVN